jgi:hypothetical protein
MTSQLIQSAQITPKPDSGSRPEGSVEDCANSLLTRPTRLPTGLKNQGSEPNRRDR